MHYEGKDHRDEIHGYEIKPTDVRLRNCGIQKAELMRFVFENNQQQSQRNINEATKASVQYDEILNQFWYLF